MRNVECLDCKTEILRIVTDEEECPMCGSHEIKYD